MLSAESVRPTSVSSEIRPSQNRLGTMSTESVPQSDLPSGSPVNGRVLVLNHRGDPLDDAVSALATAGFEVETTQSVRETQQLLATRNGDDRNLVAVVLNPVEGTQIGQGDAAATRI